MLHIEKINYHNIKEGDIYESFQQNVWVKCKIVFHYKGNPIIEILEGNLQGKQWYLFPDLKNLRRVLD